MDLEKNKPSFDGESEPLQERPAVSPAVIRRLPRYFR